MNEEQKNEWAAQPYSAFIDYLIQKQPDTWTRMVAKNDDVIFVASQKANLWRETSKSLLSTYDNEKLEEVKKEMNVNLSMLAKSSDRCYFEWTLLEIEKLQNSNLPPNKYDLLLKSLEKSIKKKV